MSFADKSNGFVLAFGCGEERAFKRVARLLLLLIVIVETSFESKEYASQKYMEAIRSIDTVENTWEYSSYVRY